MLAPQDGACALAGAAALRLQPQPRPSSAPRSRILLGLDSRRIRSIGGRSARNPTDIRFQGSPQGKSWRTDVCRPPPDGSASGWSGGGGPGRPPWDCMWGQGDLARRVASPQGPRGRASGEAPGEHHRISLSLSLSEA